MPRKKPATEAQLLAERDRIDAELRVVREKENTDLGKAVKRIFGKRLPDDYQGRLDFLSGLNQMLIDKEKAEIPNAELNGVAESSDDNKE